MPNMVSKKMKRWLKMPVPDLIEYADKLEQQLAECQMALDESEEMCEAYRGQCLVRDSKIDKLEERLEVADAAIELFCDPNLVASTELVNLVNKHRALKEI